MTQVDLAADNTPTNEAAGEGKNNERSNALRKAYGNATTRLREAHREEFDMLYQQEAQALGVDYTPRLSPEQKAEKALQDLIAEYPHLAEKVIKQS